MSAEVHAHDRGLVADLFLFDRRRMLRMMALTSAGVMIGCSGDTPESAGTPTGSASTPTAASPTAVGSVVCEEIPAETAGPFPGDGSNGPNVLDDSGFVRSDIRSSVGSSGRAQGVPLTINIALLDRAKGCAPLAGAVLYLWHCDREGRYSLYSEGATDENYLRGVQEADARGMVTFKSIFPGAYSGRWPHIHFGVYPSLARARSSATKVATSQLAFPKAVCDEVYASNGYEDSVRNMQQTSLERDNVFADGYERQLATVTGAVSSGVVANLSVPI